MLVSVLGCREAGSGGASPARTAARAAIAGDSVRARMAFLASDRFQGRAPGTLGDSLATAYIVSEFRRLGLASGPADGSFRQPVPFWAATPAWSLTFGRGGRRAVLHDSTTSVVWESSPKPEVSIEGAGLVFAGFGIDAPDVGWSDYKTDVRGKVLLVLYGEPSRADPASGQPDSSFFLGKELGWYGWLTHKFEAAAAHGAAGLILVIDQETSGIPWSAMQSYSRERSHLQPDPKYPKQVENVIAINRPAAEGLLKVAGLDYTALLKQANDSTFRPMPVPVTTSIRLTQRIRQFNSSNVVAVVAGSDPKLRQQAVVYSAHWDHMGIDSTRAGDQIYNGALDNAAGVAALIELARAFKAAPPKRSVVFVATTAEEQLLLGAQYYVYHPIVPLDSTLADLDTDGLNLNGPARAIEVIGIEETTLGDVLTPIAAAQSRSLIPSALIPAGGRYRTDRFAFARAGVPAINIQGAQLIGRTPEAEQQLALDYWVHRYHQVSDSMRSDYDFSGAADDLRAYFDLGFTIAESGSRPQWRGGRRYTLMFGRPLQQ